MRTQIAIRFSWYRPKSPNRSVNFKLAKKTPRRQVCGLRVRDAAGGAFRPQWRDGQRRGLRRVSSRRHPGEHRRRRLDCLSLTGNNRGKMAHSIRAPSPLRTGMNPEGNKHATVSDYREFPVPALLANHFLCFWTQRIVGSGEYSHSVLPDCCIDIVFH